MVIKNPGTWPVRSLFSAAILSAMSGMFSF